jgi:hypothetical protein
MSQRCGGDLERFVFVRDSRFKIAGVVILSETSASEAMPVGTEHRRNLPHLLGQDTEARLRHSRHIDPDVKHLIAPELRDDAAGNHIQMLEAGKQARQRARIRFSGDAEGENLQRFGGRIFVIHERDSSYSIGQHQPQCSPGFPRKPGE